MARKPDPKAVQNSLMIKNLLKLEPNKLCADCKKTKHPRWASWNLGVFVCIRCSGIHRGMGTHISKVKSVDLDAWTDEQLQSIVSWGNSRAKKYWEAKLDPHHIPSEAKIENFIRTKYELKRWVMDGPIPDPSTMSDDEAEITPVDALDGPLAQNTKGHTRKTSGAFPKPTITGEIDDGSAPSSYVGTASTRLAPNIKPDPPKIAVPSKDSLLGLDLFGEPAGVVPPHPANAAAGSRLRGDGGAFRPDLKQSILSLYASTAKQPSQLPQSTQTPGTFLLKGTPSPTQGYTQQKQQQPGPIHQSFGGFTIAHDSSQKIARPVDPFASLATAPANARQGSDLYSGGALGGLGRGSFFDAKPSRTPAASAASAASTASTAFSSHETKSTSSAISRFGLDVLSPVLSPIPCPLSIPDARIQPFAFGDLVGFSTPSQPPTKASPPNQSNVTGSVASSSIFNLSPPQLPFSAPPPLVKTGMAASALTSQVTATWSNSDVWASDTWTSPDPASPVRHKVTSPVVVKPSVVTADQGWNSTPAVSSSLGEPMVMSTGSSDNTLLQPPKVTTDEEFGDWTTGSTPAKAPTTKPAASFGTTEDLFSNVWQ